jgi:hypothetical protein
VKHLLPITVLLCLPSCGIYTKLNEAVDRIDLATKDADQALQGVQQGLVAMGEKGQQLADKVEQVRTALAQSDMNADGRVSGVNEWTELIYQLLAILGIGGYAVSTNAKRRASTQAIYAQLDQLKTTVRASGNPAAE